MSDQKSTVTNSTSDRTELKRNKKSSKNSQQSSKNSNTSSKSSQQTSKNVSKNVKQNENNESNENNENFRYNPILVLLEAVEIAQKRGAYSMKEIGTIVEAHRIVSSHYRNQEN